MQINASSLSPSLFTLAVAIMEESKVRVNTSSPYLSLSLSLFIGTNKRKELRRLRNQQQLSVELVHRFLPSAHSQSGMTSHSDFDGNGPDTNFDDLLRVHPTELKIPFDFNGELFSSSFQLTNITDRIVVYELEYSSRIHLVSPVDYTDLGTILPRSTSSITLTVKYLLGNMPSPVAKPWIGIYAYAVKDGVKAENITCWRDIDMYDLMEEETYGSCFMHVVYYSTVPPAANPYSAVPDMARKSSHLICDSPPSPRLRPDRSDENTNSLSEENINSGGKKKRTRGKTNVPDVAIGENNRTMIEWNEYGQPVGKNSDEFSTTVGCLVRENVPINIDTWHDVDKVDKRIKEKLWDLMMQKYVIEDCYKKSTLRLMGKLWRNWKSSLSRSIREVVDDGVDVFRHITSLKPNETTDRQWNEFVKIRTSDKFKELSQKKQTARAKQTMPYTLSRKGYARYEHEWKIENTGKSISRTDLWIEGHKKRKGEKRGQPINDAAEKAISKMEKYKELLNSENSTSINEDPVSKCFGRERSGSVRGLGFGVTPSKIEAQLQNKSWMQSVLRNELNEFCKTEERTQKIPRELRPDMFPGEPSNGRALPSPSSRQGSKVVKEAPKEKTKTPSKVQSPTRASTRITRSFKNPPGMKYFAILAQRLVTEKTTIRVPFESDLFGTLTITSLVEEDFENFINMCPLSVNCIQIYIRSLYYRLKDLNSDENVSFIDPRPSKKSGIKEFLVSQDRRARHICNSLNSRKENRLFFLPYNPSDHWVLVVIDLLLMRAYYLDSLGSCICDDLKHIVTSGLRMFHAQCGNQVKKFKLNWIAIQAPEQTGSVECGYYVMRYMKEITYDRSLLNPKYNEKSVYTFDEINEVRTELMDHVSQFLI